MPRAAPAYPGAGAAPTLVGGFEMEQDYALAEETVLRDDRRRMEDAALRAADLEENPPTSWDAVAFPEDLSPEEPQFLHRTDGKALLYPGKTHSFVGEPESGKTWMALAACAETIARGAGVLYVDFEDSARGVVRRLVALGVQPAAARRHFAYVSPAERIDAPGAKYSLVRTGRRYEPEIIVLDGVTEAMALHGWDINSATDTARFLDWFPRLWEKTGAAVVMIDHVVKSAEAQGRWAIGSQHKLAGVNGASYTFKVLDVFGRGRHGRAEIGVAKDREGEVRSFASDGKVAGVFNLRGREDGSCGWDVEPYDENAILLTLGAQVVAYLTDSGPQNMTQLHSAFSKRAAEVRQVVKEYADSGVLVVAAGPNNSKVVSVRPGTNGGTDAESG